MVAKQQHPFPGIDMFEPLNSEAVFETDNAQQQIPYEGLRHLHQRIAHTQKCDHGNKIEKPCRRDMKIAKQCGKQQCDQHADILHEVVTGKYLSKTFKRCCKLYHGIERHHQKPAEETKGKECTAQPKELRKRRDQIERKRHTRSTKRDDPRLNIVPARTPRIDRPGDHSHSHQCQKPLCSNGVGNAEFSLEILSKDRHKHLGDPPQNTQSDNTQPYNLLTTKHTKVLFQVVKRRIRIHLKMHLFICLSGMKYFCQSACKQKLCRTRSHQHKPNRGDIVQNLRRVDTSILQQRFKKDRIDHRTGEDGNHRYRLHQRIGLRELFVSDHLFDKTILCR